MDDDDLFVHLGWGWRFALHDHGWFVIDSRSIERARGQWPTWRTFN